MRRLVPLLLTGVLLATCVCGDILGRLAPVVRLVGRGMDSWNGKVSDGG